MADIKNITVNNVASNISKINLNGQIHNIVKTASNVSFGFEVVAQKTDNITWNGHREGTISISWTSNRNGYAILTKGCSIFGKYYTEVRYSIKVNGVAIDNNSSYRVDVGNDGNNRTFLFPIRVGDVINASVTGNAGSSSGTLTLRLRASKIS